MRLSRILSLGVALACLTSPLIAQQRDEGKGRGGPGGFGGVMMFGGGFGVSRLALLRVEVVQKELELVEEQVAAIQKLQEELRPQGGPGAGFRVRRGGQEGEGQGGRNRPDGERNREGKNDPNRGASTVAPADWFFVQNQQPAEGQRRPGGFGGQPLTEEQRREFERARIERARQEKAKLAEILLPHQLKRLNEIYYQQLGAAALDDEDVAKELNISDDQKAQIAKVREENQASMRTQMQELFQGAGGDREAIQKKMDELRKANDDKVLAVLTSEQKEKLKELKGKPFDLPRSALFSGRGGPGGPRGRGPGGDKKGSP